MRQALIIPSVEDLAARMAALDPCWVLTRECGQLVLRGNGAPAAWTADESCIDWLVRWERDAARQLRKRARKRMAHAEVIPMAR
jgi:hypothetical protein